jgi:DeoR family transcriptional regulator, suf operon transcriptional repressor
MSVENPNSDNDVLDLLRIAGPLSVAELADAMEVTATAVRQRLTRLMTRSLIERDAVRAGRGRPKHRYALTDKGVRQTGSNFTDLALAMWRELGTIGDEDVRRDALRRIARSLARGYADQIKGDNPNERMRSLAALLAQRRIPASVNGSVLSPALTTHACPYPSLAEHDRDVCTMERMLFSELIGGDVQLTQCRLDGGAECRFQATLSPDMIEGLLRSPAPAAGRSRP